MKKSRYLIFLLAAFSCGSPYKSAIERFNKAEYQTAIESFDKILLDNPTHTHKGQIFYYLAESYRLSNRLTKAGDYYQKAYANNFKNDQMGFYLAQSLKAQGQYVQAAEMLEQVARGSQDALIIKRAKDELAGLKSVENLSKPQKNLLVKNCEKLNTAGADYAPLLFKNRLFFTSSRADALIYAGNGSGFTDLFYVDIEQDTSYSGQITPLTPSINLSGIHEASATLSKDGKILVFARSNSGKKKDPSKEVALYMSVFDGSSWSTPQPMPFNNPKYWDGCPAFAPDNKTIYFSSNRPGSIGGLDIFKVTKDTKGEWTQISNLGRSVNTRGNEMFPFVSQDAKLYFASDGHAGLGGLDLFVATRKDKETIIKNLGAPFNSSADDFALCLRKDGKSGYFASNRAGGQGDDDIYFFENQIPKKKQARYYLEGIASFNDEEKGEIKLKDVKLVLLDSEGKKLDETRSDSIGYFKFKPELELGSDYLISANKKTFVSTQEEFTTSGKEVDEETLEKYEADTVDIVLKNNIELTKDWYEDLIENREITLRNILYDFDDFKIRPDAAKELDKLAAVLAAHPNINVELGSHTDSRGSDRYNLKLSAKRAEAAVNYIIGRGIAKNRVKAHGYGETKPVVYEATTEEEHQENRRTTVTLISEE